MHMSHPLIGCYDVTVLWLEQSKLAGAALWHGHHHHQQQQQQVTNQAPYGAMHGMVLFDDVQSA
jgi:hypothetical protein